MKKPKVENDDLQRLIDKLWSSSPNPIGDGSTADAIRHEIKTGESVKGASIAKRASCTLRL